MSPSSLFCHCIDRDILHLVKKIKLRGTESDKIFREVNALSRLNHRFVVRYYTTWVETSEPTSTAASDSEQDSETADGMTSRPVSSSRSANGSDDPFVIDLDDLGSESRHSFPSIHFTRSTSANAASDNDNDTTDSEDAYDDMFDQETPAANGRAVSRPSTPPKIMSRTLYIQMVNNCRCILVPF